MASGAAPAALPGTPGAAEREKERVIFRLLAGDVAIVLLRIPVALATGSLTLLGEVVRSSFTLGASIVAYRVLHAMHRGRLSRFEFGIGKIEQIVNALVGLGLIASGLWVAGNVVGTILAPQRIASPFGLALAATVNAVNLLRNGLGWYAIRAAAKGGASALFRVHLRSRFILMSSSIFLQVTLTAAALARDPGIGLLLDAAGAIFVVCLMLANGGAMFARALPNLLDAPPPAGIADAIARAAGVSLPEGEVVRIRSRRSGSSIFAEVAVRGAALASPASLAAGAAAIGAALRDAGENVEVSVVLATAPAD